MKHCLSFSYFTFFHTESQYSVNDYQVCFTTSPDNAFTHLVLHHVLFLFPQKEVYATNRKIFITTMSVKPDSIKHKYLFLVDDYQIACSMIALGFHAFFLSSDESDFNFTVCSLTDYPDELSFSSKYNADYTYVPAIPVLCSLTFSASRGHASISFQSLTPSTCGIFLICSSCSTVISACPDAISIPIAGPL